MFVASRAAKGIMVPVVLQSGWQCTPRPALARPDVVTHVAVLVFAYINSEQGEMLLERTRVMIKMGKGIMTMTKI